MNLTQDEIKDKIFELEMGQKELKILIKLATPCECKVIEDLDKQIEENQCWVAYYKDLLKEIKQGE